MAGGGRAVGAGRGGQVFAALDALVRLDGCAGAHRGGGVGLVEGGGGA